MFKINGYVHVEPRRGKSVDNFCWLVADIPNDICEYYRKFINWNLHKNLVATGIKSHVSIFRGMHDVKRVFKREMTSQILNIVQKYKHEDIKIFVKRILIVFSDMISENGKISLTSKYNKDKILEVLFYELSRFDYDILEKFYDNFVFEYYSKNNKKLTMMDVVLHRQKHQKKKIKEIRKSLFALKDKQVKIYYDNYVYNDKGWYMIDVQSNDIDKIREQLNCGEFKYHITIAKDYYLHTDKNKIEFDRRLDNGQI